MSLKTRLFMLALSLLLPALFGAAYGLHMLREQQIKSSSEALMELTHALAGAVERELAARESMLKALALSPALQQRDLRAFYEHARNAAPTFETVFVVSLPSGAQVLNTRVPLDQPLLPSTSTAFGALRAAAGSTATLVSDLYLAPVGKQHSFAVQVPVMDGGGVAYYLAIGSFAAQLQRLLDDQRLRAGWNASILDRKGTIVARRIRPEDFVGKPATKDFLRHMSVAAEGVFETVRLDETSVLTAYSPIGTTGWTMAVSMPKAELTTLAGSAYQFTLAVTLGLFVLATLGVIVVARPINSAVVELVDLARTLGRGEPVRPPRHRIRETQRVAEELARASEQLRALNDTLEARVRDAVAESHRAQEALLQHQKLEALGRLTGGIAHDFNNILQTLRVSLELAGRLAVVDTVRQAIDAGRRAVDRGTQLTRQLLTFGRSTASTRTTLHLPVHIDGSLDLLRGALRQNVDLRIALPADLWPVTVDPVQLDLALLNIALNARDAMPSGGTVEIKADNVTLRPGDMPDLVGDFVRVAIHDSGSGIPPDVLPHVFEPFFTTKPVGQGSGLGLAQVYGFAKQSGGTATIASRSGEGTWIAIYLPRASIAPPDTAGRARAGTSRAARDERRTVLFVDDDPLIASVMVPALVNEGFAVLSASDALAAQRLLASHRVDVMLSDIVMPGGTSGLDLARVVAERYPDVHVVLATGYSDQIGQGVPFPVLHKPYAVQQLLDVLHDLARNRMSR